MKRLARAWVQLWDRREPATAQALVRIFVGLCILGDLLDVQRLGLIEALWGPPPDGMGSGNGWLDPSPASVRLLWWLGIAAGAAFTFGLATRVAGVLLVLVSAQLGALAPDGDRGIDVALRTVTLVLVFSSCHARWSIDAAICRRLGRPFPALVLAWPRYLLFAQLVWIYFSSAQNKAEPEWTPVGGFSALGNALSDPHFARFSSDWVAPAWPLPAIATATTMLFEWCAPLLFLFVWFETTADRPGRARRFCNRWRLRWLWISLGLLFHLGIAVFMRLGVFPWGMLAIYPVLLRADELVRAEGWVRARFAGARG